MLPFLDEVPNVVIITGAVIAALGVIWRKVVVPVRNWTHDLKVWMKHTGEQLGWVEAQMRTNGGSSLVDKVNTTADKVEKLIHSVELLLTHDAERDTPGHRYGSDNQEEQQ